MFEPLPDLVRQRREQLGFSQRKVAQLADVGLTHYALFENGRANVSVAFLLKVARILGMAHLQVEDLSLAGSSSDVTVLVRAQQTVEKARHIIANVAEL